jgi:hypothetical protein
MSRTGAKAAVKQMRLFRSRQHLADALAAGIISESGAAVPVVLAVAVSGARLARRPCVSLLVLPGSAVRAAVAARPAFWPYRRSPLLVPAWSGAGQSSGITSPKRLAGAAITSLPLLSKLAGVTG